MNTVSSTQVDKQQPRHPQRPEARATSTRRVSLPDRVALHLGVALITWSRRPRTSGKRVRVTDLRARNERARERAARERDWQLALYLSRPWR